MSSILQNDIDKPIVSVNIMGGLGNQMFQLATAYSYAKMNNGSLKILQNKQYDDGRPLYWDNILHKFKKDLVDKLPDGLSHWNESGATEFSIIPSLPNNGIFLKGYLQSPKYFSNKNIISDLYYLFRPDQTTLEYIYSKYLYLLENRDRIVVVHARRTDYLRNQDIINFHGPLTIDYYKKAIDKILKEVQNPILLLTSDDTTYWKETIKEIEEFRNIEITVLENEDEINTLALLQQFNYFIIANSTFSWWAAWLATNPKKVIAPSKWFGPTGPQNYKDIYMPEWELI